MDLYDVMRTTAAVREFTDDPLPDDVLHTILDNARFAPSGGNRQGSQVVVVRDPATRERLLEITGPGARRYQAQVAAGETPWSGYVPSRVTEEQVARTDRGAGLRRGTTAPRPSSWSSAWIFAR